MSLKFEDIERIKQVKYRYCRALDTGDFDALEDLLTEDIEIDYRGASYHFALKGRDEMIAAMRQAFHADFVGSHTVHMPVIDVHEDGLTADGVWTLLDYGVQLHQGKSAISGYCIYSDRYRKEDGIWRIARSSYERVFEKQCSESAAEFKGLLLRKRLLEEK